MTASDRHDDPSNGPGGNSIHRDGANVRRKAQRHALIVDDDGLFAKSLARMLAALGCVAKVTPSGSDALAYLQANPVDLIFSDLQMPGMNGLDFIERAREAGVAAPFVLMTGGAGPRDIVLALRLGAVDCLLKPFDRAELIEVMARALGGVGPPAAVASDPETAPMPTPPVPPPSQPALRPAGPPSPPTPTSTPSAAPGPSPLEPDLRARVELAVEHDTLDLPFPAAALQQLLELNADLEPSAHELAAIVREVPTMASMVIRMGGGSVPPPTVDEAVERLGAQRALNSLLTGVSRRVAKTLVREPADLVHDLWVNHLVSARIAEHCARDVLPSLAVQAHALTLFMEVGEFVVLRAIATVAPELLAQAREPGSVVQQLIIGLHAQAGRHALRRWGLPQIFVQLAATHGEALPLDEELTPDQKLWLIVRLARDLTPRLTHVAIPSAHHVVTDDERRAMPELTAARLNRYAHLAVEDVKVVLGKSQNTGGLGV